MIELSSTGGGVGMVDDAAFARWLVEEQLVMRRFAVTLITAGDVEDLVQDCLARAWGKLSTALENWTVATLEK